MEYTKTASLHSISNLNNYNACLFRYLNCIFKKINYPVIQILEKAKKSKKKFLRLPVIFIAGILIIAFTGCSPQTRTASLSIDTTQTFSQSGTEIVPERWWTAFEDRALNQLVDSALEHNFTLKTAWERLQESRAVAERESASFWPGIDASARSEAARYQTEYVQNLGYEVGLSAGYEVDLWGRIDSRVEAERLRSQSSLEDYKTAALSLSAEIVRNWYQLIEAQNQLELANEQVQTNKKMLKMMETRFGSGQVRSADILRQRQLLESTKEQKITTETRVHIIENQLSVLIGNTPVNQRGRSTDSLPELPPLPKTGISAELIKRRPDVQSAFNLLQAADKDLAAAISNQYPRFSISASYSTSADNVENLFREWGYSLAGNLLAPIFYGGELKAEVDRSEAIKNQMLFDYGQTILEALKEVEDALVQEKKQKEKIQSIKEQVKLAQQTYEQLRVEYFNGLGSYIDVLTALDELQRLRRELLTEKMTMFEYRINLYRALAGGFKTERETKE
ncbi:MAG: efflux transporter outer membrane subunit [Bacteroidales bacterium]